MDNTFINIGKAIRKSDIAKSEFYPMISSRNLAEKEKVKEDIVSYDVTVNMDNETVQINTSEIVPKLKTIKFVVSSADTVASYLCGSTVIKVEDFLEQVSFRLFEDKYVKQYKITSDSLIYKYRKILERNSNLFAELYEKEKENKKVKEISLSVDVVMNGRRDKLQSFVGFLDEMDSMFLQKNFIKGKGYVFLSSFYNMFNYGKFEIRGVKTMPEGSIPYFSKDDFLNLYYARSVFNKKGFMFGDYSVSILPNYENITYEDIDYLSPCGKNIFNFDLFCNTIQNFIESKSKRDLQLKKMIPLQLKFDLYYKYRTKLGDSNMLRLSGIRYSQIIGIRDHLNESYKLIYGEKNIPGNFLIAVLLGIYQDYNKKNDRYNSLILKTLQNIYQGNYRVPPQAEFCLLDNSQHIARTDEGQFAKKWNDIFKIYKFLKTMENKSFVSDLLDSNSYKLGAELAKFESGWKKGRENLKKTIQQFTGNVSRRVYKTQDVFLYYIDLCERMQRNRITPGEHNELLVLLQSMKDEGFEKNKFIMGYFAEKNTYNAKENEGDENAESEEKD